MPLQTGKSDAAMSSNISLMIREYRRSGKIGDTTPDDAKHAQKIAAAIAYEKAGRSRK